MAGHADARGLLAAECEPWAKTGGSGRRGRRPGAGARPSRTDAVDTPVDVLPARYRGVPNRRRSTGGRSSCARPALPGRPQRRHRLDVAGRRLPLAPGRPSRRRSIARASTATRRGLRRQRLAVRAVLPGALEALGPTSGRSTSCISTTGTRARGAVPRCLVRATIRSSGGGHPDHAPQPGLSRLDAAERAPPARLAPATGRPGRGATASTCCGRASSGPSSSTPCRRASPSRPGPRLRDGPRRRAAARGRPVHRHPQRPRHHGLGSLHRSRTWPRPTPAGPIRARRPAGPTCSPRRFDAADRGRSSG
jgi:hypothetical protein